MYIHHPVLCKLRLTHWNSFLRRKKRHLQLGTKQGPLFRWQSKGQTRSSVCDTPRPFEPSVCCVSLTSVARCKTARDPFMLKNKALDKKISTTDSLYVHACAFELFFTRRREAQHRPRNPEGSQEVRRARRGGGLGRIRQQVGQATAGPLYFPLCDCRRKKRRKRHALERKGQDKDA